MQKRKPIIFLLLALTAGLLLAACETQPETVEVEVTRVVEAEPETETVIQEVEVTRVVEGETVTETVVEEVEVTRVVVADCAIQPPAEPVAATYIGWPFRLFDEYLAFLDDCSAVSNVTVDVLVMDNASAIEQMSLAFSSGGESPYAIIHQSNSSIQQNVWNDWLTPLTDYVEKYRDQYDLDDIDPGMWDGATFEGEIYGIPMGANAIMLMYRKDLFEKYDLEVPTTYDEIINACEVLKDEPGIDTPFALDLSAGWAWEIAFREALGSLGGQYFEEGSNVAAFNTPEGVAALEKIMEVVDACMGQEGLTYGSGGMSAGLGNGTIAFIHTWATSGVSLLDPESSDFHDQIAFAPAASLEPGGTLAGSAWGDFWAIPASYEGDKELVFQLIMEAGRADHQLAAIEEGMVTRTSALTSDKAAAFAPVALETIANGVGATPRRVATPTLTAVLGNYLPLVGIGDMTPAEALQAAEDEYIAEATAKGYLE
ncbi:MAG: extracellular solute-binding protein [Candidatus Promineifilaceae bacterium]|nr:extracellular solute-binding protein [Candidatus Promineifilaceae bacterium]